ncbi:MAG TPA: 4-(cytidine 5'-diphospho)-2-C-methyl-D-erythritol kinase [Dysgonamonadaceae bacterium]|nr:4-(cytidine 5'-diphospho)-2-C-methyl-D-erythritol kinase [Dysgonamonadaceae bacterium]
MICFPNAKINLGLNIVSKRKDGYHNIETIFYPIGLKDALEVLPSENNDIYTLFSSGIDVGANPETNLVVKALNLMRSQKHIPNVDIHLLKKIPSGAGLGGGSSDGAFMLNLLNNTFALGFTNHELHQFAVKLGADCAFFLNNKPAFAFGIGDKLENIELSLEHYYVLLVKPNISVSTKEAYAEIVPKQPEISLKEIVKLPVHEWRNYMHNDFEAPIFKKHPAIAQIKQTLYDNGAVYASMSGSGTSVYGFFDKKPISNFPNCFVWSNYL